MKEFKIGKHKVKVYDSIEELPVVRHHKFSKLMLIDAQVGSTLTDFDAHVERVIRYMRSDKRDLAEKELMVLRQNIYFIQTEISPRHLAYAALVHTIDGKVNNDLSDEALKAITDKLADVPEKELDSIIHESKKKLEQELQVYFPSLFDSSEVKEYYGKLKRRIVLMAKSIEEGLTPEEEQELDKLTTDVLLFTDPGTFSGPDSLEVQQDKQFENSCLLISQATGADAKKFTTMQYYNALLYLREQNKKAKKPRK